MVKAGRSEHPCGWQQWSKLEASPENDEGLLLRASNPNKPIRLSFVRTLSGWGDEMDERLYVRCSASEKDRWLAAAEGQKLSEWIRKTLNESTEPEACSFPPLVTKMGVGRIVGKGNRPPLVIEDPEVKRPVKAVTHRTAGTAATSGFCSKTKYKRTDCLCLECRDWRDSNGKT